jgi:predicted anti-sigma-YlaC factor YlaD
VECLTEFTCSVFVDGELTDLESRQVEEHLEICGHCRAMSAAFREEHRLLIASIQEMDLTDPAESEAPVTAARPVTQARPVDVLKWGGALVGLSALIRIAMSSPDQLSLPSIPVNLDWLNPSNLSGSLNWLTSTIAYFASEGVSRMTSLADSLSFVALIVLVFAGAVMLVRRSIGRGAMVATLGLLLFIVSATPGFAMEKRVAGDSKIVSVPAGQTVDDNLFAAGDTVIIDGTINGDLIAIARTVTINGTVKGNVLTAASSVEVPGVVEGTIIAGGQSVQIDGTVARNMVGFGQSITVGKNATIGGDAVVVGNPIHMNGTVAHSFYSTGFTDIGGSVGRNMVFQGAVLTVLPSASIAGNLESHVPRAEMVHVDPAAKIGGKQTVELPKPGTSRYATFGFYFSQLLHVAAAFVAGFLLLLIFPRLRRAGFSDIISVLKSGGIGFLLVFATPIAAICVAITLIGMPIAFVGFVTWLLGLYLAKIVVANFIGRTLLASQGDRMTSVALGLLVGLVLTFIAINLPYVGGLIHFVLVLVGFGALAMNAYGAFRAEPDSGR